jgi:hypothetical protein
LRCHLPCPAAPAEGGQPACRHSTSREWALRSFCEWALRSFCEWAMRSFREWALRPSYG